MNKRYLVEDWVLSFKMSAGEFNDLLIASWFLALQTEYMGRPEFRNLEHNKKF